MSRPSRCRLLACDVDGTLLRGDASLSPQVAAAVRRAAEGGVEVVLCSGRRIRMLLRLIDALDLPSPVVANSGTLVKDPQTRENLWAEYLDADLAAEIVEELSGRGIAHTVHVDSGLDDIDFLVPSRANAPEFFDGYLDRNRGLWEPGRLDGHRLRDRVTVICAAGTPRHLRELAGDLARGRDGAFNHHVVSNVDYVGELLEIYSPKASKWKAVSWIAKTRGLQPADIAAVGDDENDIEMIQNAGLGAAVANAAPPVKAAAKMLIPSNDDDGIAALIEQILA
jgi:Cof subfamily protein (haloacid dehalogenase superfamily)